MSELTLMSERLAAVERELQEKACFMREERASIQEVMSACTVHSKLLTKRLADAEEKLEEQKRIMQQEPTSMQEKEDSMNHMKKELALMQSELEKSSQQKKAAEVELEEYRKSMEEQLMSVQTKLKAVEKESEERCVSVASTKHELEEHQNRNRQLQEEMSACTADSKLLTKRLADSEEQKKAAKFELEEYRKSMEEQLMSVQTKLKAVEKELEENCVSLVSTKQELEEHQNRIRLLSFNNEQPKPSVGLTPEEKQLAERSTVLGGLRTPLELYRPLVWENVGNGQAALKNRFQTGVAVASTWEKANLHYLITACDIASPALQRMLVLAQRHCTHSEYPDRPFQAKYPKRNLSLQEFVKDCSSCDFAQLLSNIGHASKSMVQECNLQGLVFDVPSGEFLRDLKEADGRWRKEYCNSSNESGLGLAYVVKEVLPTSVTFWNQRDEEARNFSTMLLRAEQPCLELKNICALAVICEFLARNAPLHGMSLVDGKEALYRSESYAVVGIRLIELLLMAGQAVDMHLKQPRPGLNQSWSLPCQISPEDLHSVIDAHLKILRQMLKDFRQKAQILHLQRTNARSIPPGIEFDALSRFRKDKAMQTHKLLGMRIKNGDNNVIEMYCFQLRPRIVLAEKLEQNQVECAFQSDFVDLCRPYAKTYPELKKKLEEMIKEVESGAPAQDRGSAQEKNLRAELVSLCHDYGKSS